MTTSPLRSRRSDRRFVADWDTWAVFSYCGGARLMSDQWGDFNISTMNYNELLAGKPFVVADDYHVYRLGSSGRLLRQPVGTKFPQNWKFCGVLLGRRFRWFRAYAVFQCVWLGHRVVVEVPMHKMEQVAGRADQWG